MASKTMQKKYVVYREGSELRVEVYDGNNIILKESVKYDPKSVESYNNIKNLVNKCLDKGVEISEGDITTTISEPEAVSPSYIRGGGGPAGFIGSRRDKEPAFDLGYLRDFEGAYWDEMLKRRPKSPFQPSSQKNHN